MSAKPRLPDGVELPTEVNGWTHDPDSGKNAHVWVSDDETASVGVFSSLGRVYAKVFDERVNGLENGVRLTAVDLDDDDQFTETERQTVADVLDEAIAWMREHAPAEWEHPDVNEAVFDAPPGYELEVCYLEQRDTTVYYHRADAGEAAQRDDDGDLPEPTPETHPYLVIHTWNGSGNSEISLAPWTRAHDHQMTEVVETPEECGLDVALTMARSYAREHVDGADESGSPAGQADLQQFAEAGQP
jgi:hypothetical protein